MTNYQPYPNPESGQPGSSAPRRLVRRQQDKMIAGVCSGIADYLRVDVNVVRLVVVATVVLTSGCAALVYLAAWWLMPRA